MKRHFKSGMLQGWNKFCFTGGILEVDVVFPGRSDVGGLWPAVWMLGNLGRATYEASTNLMWPWSYNECNRALQHAQELSGCDVTQHWSLNPKQGRGATEIDIIEVMSGPSTALPLVKNDLRRPYSSMTLQVEPTHPTLLDLLTDPTLHAFSVVACPGDPSLRQQAPLGQSSRVGLHMVRQRDLRREHVHQPVLLRDLFGSYEEGGARSDSC